MKSLQQYIDESLVQEGFLDAIKNGISNISNKVLNKIGSKVLKNFIANYKKYPKITKVIKDICADHKFSGKESFSDIYKLVKSKISDKDIELCQSEVDVIANKTNIVNESYYDDYEDSKFGCTFFITIIGLFLGIAYSCLTCAPNTKQQSSIELKLDDKEQETIKYIGDNVITLKVEKTNNYNKRIQHERDSMRQTDAYKLGRREGYSSRVNQELMGLTPGKGL